MMRRKIDAQGRVGGYDNEVEFEPPKGLELEGKQGTAQVSWYRKPDGKICIRSIDGVSLNGGDGGEESDERESESGIDDMEYDDGNAGPSEARD